jgi:hypothetical protein
MATGRVSDRIGPGKLQKKLEYGKRRLIQGRKCGRAHLLRRSRIVKNKRLGYTTKEY